MFKIIANRGSGKTTSLMRYANDLAHQHSDKMVFFVCSSPYSMVDRFLRLTKEQDLPQNLCFISYNYFLTKVRGMKNYIAVVDELDYWLKNNLNIVGYTNSLGEDI